MALALVALISAGCGGGLASSRRPAKPDPAAGIARHLQVLAGGRDVWEANRCTGLSPTARGGAAAATRRPAVWNVKAEVAEVADGVEKVRGLTFEHRVKPEFLRNQDIAYRFADPLRGGVATPYFEVDERLLSTLGAMFSGVDLQRLSGRAVAGGLEGLYEPADRHLMVRRRGKLGPQERFVLSHELTHALDDQRIGIDLSAPRDADASLALNAAVEGDATLAMNRYAARFLEPGGQAAAFRAADPKTDSPLVSEIPHYVYARGRFPYAAGFRFMCRVYLRDGRAGLDRALREPPSTTAQVLFPERYARREAPATPAPTGSLPSPWRLAAARTFGAADLLWLYEAPAGAPSPSAPRRRMGRRRAEAVGQGQGQRPVDLARAARRSAVFMQVTCPLVPGELPAVPIVEARSRRGPGVAGTAAGRRRDAQRSQREARHRSHAHRLEGGGRRRLTRAIRAAPAGRA